LPDDPGHLVAIEFDDGILHLDFRHRRSGLFDRAWRVSRAIAPPAFRRKSSGYAVAAQK
jgi:hypothetical protein